MTPHPLATWVQMTVSAQREAHRRQRGRTIRRVVLERRAEVEAEPSRRTIPVQRSSTA